MKNIFKLSFFGVAMTVAFSSCLKDKGFDNGDYGIQVIEKKGVSLPQSIAGSVDYGLLSSDAPQFLASPIVALETVGAQSTDVTVQFALKPELVSADPDLTLLPASAYTTNLTATIKAGTLLDTLEITIPRASDLDPNLTYGLGLELVSASNGFTVASNMKEVLIRITVKNIYDGEYLMKGRHNRTPYDFPYEAVMHMITTGASSVIFYWPDAGSVGHPIGTGPDPVNDVSWYGAAIAPHVVFNPATNLVANVFNNAGGTPIDIYTGAGSGVGRYEPGPKKMYVYWRYNFNDLRGFMDTLTYIGSR